jgi:hypothetical protein
MPVAQLVSVKSRNWEAYVMIFTGTNMNTMRSSCDLLAMLKLDIYKNATHV